MTGVDLDPPSMDEDPLSAVREISEDRDLGPYSSQW